MVLQPFHLPISRFPLPYLGVVTVGQALAVVLGVGGGAGWAYSTYSDYGANGKNGMPGHAEAGCTRRHADTRHAADDECLTDSPAASCDVRWRQCFRACLPCLPFVP